MKPDLLTKTVILMGGPCSGQTHAVPVDCAAITAVDAAGGVHEYVKTDVTVDADDGGPAWVVFRRAAPAPAV